MTSRPDDELPESRRAYVAPPMRPVPPPTPAQEARDTREGAGLGRLTAVEQVLVGTVVLGYVAAHTLVTRAWDSPYTGREFFALLGPLVAMNALTLLYMERRPPWPGPAWWVARRERRHARRGDRVRLPRTRSALRPVGSCLGRFGGWWCRPGRLGLAVALFGALFVVSALASADSDAGLIKDLRAHGVEAPATIADTDYAPRVGRTAADVRFVVAGVSRDEALLFMDDKASTVPEGTPVTVVYDPDDPSRVLLRSQLDGRQVRDGHIMAWMSGLVAVAGFIWWVVQWPHRRTPD